MMRAVVAGLFCVTAWGVAFTMNELPSIGDEPKPAPKKLLRHVVLFKFKESAGKQDVQRVVDAFAGLPKKIDAIHDFEMGTDVSVENKSHGFTHGFVVTFRDEKARDEYLPHQAHQEFVGLVRPVIDDVLVFDYWAER